MKKILIFLFFYTIGTCIFAPEAFAQVPAVSNPTCAYCGIRLTSSTKPWDHKTGCEYYSPQLSSSSSSVSSTYLNSSGSATVATADMVTKAIGNALVNWMNKPAKVSSTTVQKTTAQLPSEKDKDRLQWKYGDYRVFIGTKRKEYVSGEEINGLGIVNTKTNEKILDPDQKPYSGKFFLSRLRFQTGEDSLLWVYGGKYLKKDLGRVGFGILKIKNGNLTEVIPTEKYKRISFITGTKLLYAENWKYLSKSNEILDLNGNSFLPGIYSCLGFKTTPSPSDSLKRSAYIVVSSPDGRRIFNSDGEIITPAQYTWVDLWEFDDGLAIPAKKDDGRCGLLDLNGNIVIPMIYDELSIFIPDKDMFKQSKVDISKVGERLIRVKNGDKYGLFNYKGRLIAPVKYDSTQLDVMALLYPQTSFLYYVRERVIDLISHQGEFETTAEFEVRKNNQELQEAYVYKQMPKPDADFIEWTLKKIKNPFAFKLGRYNADNETFLLTNSATPRNDYRLYVPRSEAEHFKACFDSIQSAAIPTSQCFIEEDAISVGEVIFTTPDGKVYKYINPACKRNMWPVTNSKIK